MIENGHLGCAKVKKEAITQERKLFSEIRQPLSFSEDLAGKCDLSHTCHTPALELVVNTHTRTHKLTTITLVRMRAER